MPRHSCALLEGLSGSGESVGEGRPITLPPLHVLPDLNVRKPCHVQAFVQIPLLRHNRLNQWSVAIQSPPPPRWTWNFQSSHCEVTFSFYQH